MICETFSAHPAAHGYRPRAWFQNTSIAVHLESNIKAFIAHMKPLAGWAGHSRGRCLGTVLGRRRFVVQ